MVGSSRRGYLGYEVIGAFKLVSAVLLVAAGFGILHYLDKDLGAAFQRLVAVLKLDPDNRLIHTALERVAGLDQKHLKALGLGTFLYALLHLIEGVGLLLRYRWACYMTIVITSSLVPFEVYEVFKKPTAVRIGVLVVNLAIVVYLAVKLRQERAESSAVAVGAGQAE